MGYRIMKVYNVDEGSVNGKWVTTDAGMLCMIADGAQSAPYVAVYKGIPHGELPYALRFEGGELMIQIPNGRDARIVKMSVVESLLDFLDIANQLTQ